MTKYVELNAVLDAIGNQQDGTGMTFEALSHAMRDVMSLPQVDAVPVIRCKDCKFFQINKFDDTYIDMMCTENYDGYGAYMSTRPDYFCSNAERKEE